MYPLHEGNDLGKIAKDARDLRLLPSGGIDYRHYIARGRRARAEVAASLFRSLAHGIASAFSRPTGQDCKRPAGQPC